jgi:DNA-binding transcriptional regulator GbsR (MarR family)
LSGDAGEPVTSGQGGSQPRARRPRATSAIGAVQARPEAAGAGPADTHATARPAATQGEPGRADTHATAGDGRAASDRTAEQHPALSPGRDPAAVRQFIERFTALLMQAGFPRTPARIFVALLTSDSSKLTAAELGDLLQASPASVSGGARYLIQVGLVTAEGEPGSRRQHYRMPDDVWQDIVRLRDRQFTRWAAELKDGVAVLGADSAAGGRLADTVQYFEFISGEMASLLARWEQRKKTGSS